MTMETIVLIILLLALAIGAMAVFISACNFISDMPEYDEMWEFDNCHYKGNCLTDCAYRSECPFYSYLE